MDVKNKPNGMETSVQQGEHILQMSEFEQAQ